MIGQNSLLLTPEFGPRVRLTAIITDAEIESDYPLERDFCKSCDNICIEECLADAIKEPAEDSSYEIDKFACCNSLGSRADCRGCLTECSVGRAN